MFYLSLPLGSDITNLCLSFLMLYGLARSSDLSVSGLEAAEKLAGSPPCTAELLH